MEYLNLIKFKSSINLGLTFDCGKCVGCAIMTMIMTYIFVVTWHRGHAWWRHEMETLSAQLVLCKRSSQVTALRWRHNDHDGVSNHQPHGCLLNRLIRRRSKKTSKLRVTGLCVGSSPGPVNSPHKGPVTRKMFPFNDVIMVSIPRAGLVMHSFAVNLAEETEKAVEFPMFRDVRILM